MNKLLLISIFLPSAILLIPFGATAAGESDSRNSSVCHMKPVTQPVKINQNKDYSITPWLFVISKCRETFVLQAMADQNAIISPSYYFINFRYHSRSSSQWTELPPGVIYYRFDPVELRIGKTDKLHLAVPLANLRSLVNLLKNSKLVNLLENSNNEYSLSEYKFQAILRSKDRKKFILSEPFSIVEGKKQPVLIIRFETVVQPYRKFTARLTAILETVETNASIGHTPCPPGAVHAIVTPWTPPKR